MRKPFDVVLAGSLFAARDLFMDARDLAREQRTGIAWTATRLRLEYVDRIVEWVPVRTAPVHLRGLAVRNVHVDAGVPADAITDSLIETLVMASTPYGRRDWTWGDGKVEQAIQRRRGDNAAATEAHGR